MANKAQAYAHCKKDPLNNTALVVESDGRYSRWGLEGELNGGSRGWSQLAEEAHCELIVTDSVQLGYD